jgi:hypothetical protein
MVPNWPALLVGANNDEIQKHALSQANEIFHERQFQNGTAITCSRTRTRERASLHFSADAVSPWPHSLQLFDYCKIGVFCLWQAGQ